MSATRKITAGEYVHLASDARISRVVYDDGSVWWNVVTADGDALDPFWTKWEAVEAADKL